jgi:uncharacterized protein (DUF58 family)
MQVLEPSRAWMSLLIALAGTFLCAWFWTRALGKSLSVRRETRLGWVQVGGRAEERLTVSNTCSFPASRVEFHDRSTLPGFDASRRSCIAAGHFDLWTVNAACERRGTFQLGGASIRTGDPFGLFEVTIEAPQQTSILVLPRIAPLPDLAISTSGAQGDGRPRRGAQLQTIHAATVREFAPGDGMRQIHWPTTARTNKVFVRQMESAPQGNWWIALDLDERFMRGEGWDSVEEQTVTLAASLADRGLRDRFSVGLLVNGRELAWLPLNSGEGQRWEMMQALAEARPGRRTLASTLERIGSRLGRNHSLVVITACTPSDWLSGLLPLANRGIVPTVFLLDLSGYDTASSSTGSEAIFDQHGIRCHVLPRGAIRPPQPGAAEPVKWTWHTTPAGTIVPVRN